MRRTVTKFALVIVLLLVAAFIGSRQGVPAQSRPTIATEADFQRALKDVSNWGRWGKDDEMGSSNLITPAKRKQAAALVKEGISVSLAHDVVEDGVDGSLGLPLGHVKLACNRIDQIGLRHGVSGCLAHRALPRPVAGLRRTPGTSTRAGGTTSPAHAARQARAEERGRTARV